MRERAGFCRKVVLIGAAAALMFFGALTFSHQKIDVFPEFAPPTVEVQTECVGLSPQEVEQAVTTPLEQALSGTPELDVMRSSSISQFSDIVMLFKQGDATGWLRPQPVANRSGQGKQWR